MCQSARFMAKRIDISDEANTRRMPYSVPEGYFEKLQARLRVIPSEHPLPVQTAADVRPSLFVRLRPYIALAAAFIFMVVAGTGILKLSTGNLNSNSYENEDLYSYAEYVLRTDPYAFYEENTGELLTEEDIADYLINTGVPVEHIYYYGNE